MAPVTSQDGTHIVYERTGDGPPLILVAGASADRAAGRPLAALLEQHFTVFTYDRRGRGDGGDTLPYAVQREVEDIEALMTEAGAPAHVFGWSSVTVPALVMDGGASPKFVHSGAKALVDLLPDARRRTLEGQTHGAPPDVLAPVLVEFFAA